MGNSRSQSTLSTGQKAPSAKRCIKTKPYEYQRRVVLRTSESTEHKKVH